MRARPHARAGARARSIAFAMAALAVFGTRPDAQAQDYVHVCTLYGAGFSYLPGTGICLNADSRDARMQTSGGTWRWWMPSDPVEPVGSLRSRCGGGLVKFADIDSSGLLINTREQFETITRMPISLEHEEYISEVIYRGGFTGVDRGNFCLFYSADEPGQGRGYSPIGCVDTAVHAASEVPVAFTPRSPRPPASLGQNFVVGANGYPWPVTTPAEVGGRLEVWLCIKRGLRS
jgi:hypothetical protein